MSLVVLEAFQTYLDSQTPWLKLLSKAAYTVYLIHPTTVAGLASLWVYIYEAMGYGEIDFFDNNLYLETPIAGDGWNLLISWIVVNLACHCIIWPLAWCIQQQLLLLHNILRSIILRQSLN
jgi:hypothetical protein